MTAAPPSTANSVDAHVRLVTEQADDRSRRAVLAARRRHWSPALVCALSDEVTKRTRIDLADAESLSKATSWLAARVDDRYATARSQRAAGHVASLRNRYREALTLYRRARHGFRATRAPLDEAITLSGALQTLIYLGRYAVAVQWADVARRVFARLGDELRLARLDTNVGNILHRLDRFDEARERYATALETFVALGQPQDQAIVLRNMAVCSVGLNRFDEAMTAYRRARECSLAHQLHGLVAEVDYNIAYLHYLRGDYHQAIELYNQARQRCIAAEDPYHAALCDLDQAELSLELNLLDEGHELALAAYDRFSTLGLDYERAKALTNLATAAQRRGQLESAAAIFARARGLFAREGNQVWTAQLDLLRGSVLAERRQPQAARRLIGAGQRFFARSPFRDRAALGLLLQARLDVDAGRLTEARRRSGRALRTLGTQHVPALAFRLWHLRGEIEEAAGRPVRALGAYERAHAQIEDMRGNLRSEHLKVAFLKDKLSVYERLVRLLLTGPRPSIARAFRYMEHAKSRALAEHLVNERLTSGLSAAPARAAWSTQSTSARDALAVHYRLLSEEQARPQGGRRAQLSALVQRISRLERQMSRRFETRQSTPATPVATEPPRIPAAEVAQAASVSAHAQAEGPGPVSLDTLRETLGPSTVLIEYFTAEDVVYGWCVEETGVRVVPLAALTDVIAHLRFLRFQLARQPWRRGGGPEAGDDAATTHLASLYSCLLGPFDDALARRQHLVVVPHGALHALPFHALVHDGRPVVDRITCSSAPSATAYVETARRAPTKNVDVLVLGVPDQSAPQIADEVGRVGAMLGTASVWAGSSATRGRLVREGPRARIVHLATHGHFRADNPLFSTLEMADGPLMLYDLYDIAFDADLVTLSGCGTGLQTVVGGDEPYGLTRGMLQAGARSVLATLWDTHDGSATHFMGAFYDAIVGGESRAAALRSALTSTRDRYPHPYHWAPFTLVGAHGPLPTPAGPRDRRGR
ncbi:MAG: CHAT domain-containing tetratricopeptide repeat protein [Vicinamibacterales bacterium]